VAYDLTEFTDILGRIGIDSIYFHLFEARLRLGRPTNDFSLWIESSLGKSGLAGRIAKLDPYTCTLESLRARILEMIRGRAAGEAECRR
jgi:hypothetical protein